MRVEFVPLDVCGSQPRQERIRNVFLIACSTDGAEIVRQIDAPDEAEHGVPPIEFPIEGNDGDEIVTSGEGDDQQLLSLAELLPPGTLPLGRRKDMIARLARGQPSPSRDLESATVADDARF